MFGRLKESCPATSKTAGSSRVKYVKILLYSKIHIYTIHLFFTLREKMAQAYDFALDKIGMEIMSYQVRTSELSIWTCICVCMCYPPPSDRYSLLFQIWVDYINFLKGVYVYFSPSNINCITWFNKSLKVDIYVPLVRLWARTQRTNGSLQCEGCTRGAA